MATCGIRWRSSGGRGEFEYVPSGSLEDRKIDVLFEALGVNMPAEVRGAKVQGKPRLRKFDANNRQKLHLPQLVMAVCRLPEPGREDLSHTVAFPLENKSFVMDEMHFDIITDDGITATLAPLYVSIHHTDFTINLQDRLEALGKDLAEIDEILVRHPQLADAISAHGAAVAKCVNTKAIRDLADDVITRQATIFGMTNAGSAIELERLQNLPPSELEDNIVGIEGRLLTRSHTYKERSGNAPILAKRDFKSKHGGRLFCEACGFDPVATYGATSERCIEAHHKTPIAELQPDSITRSSDLLMVCANCHRFVHSQIPCLTLEQVRQYLATPKNVEKDG
ncbi:hypothetical protein JVX98_27075 [Ensifer sp. PDNC004]|uniref:HNH endonuclease n=1 Tax=Ensifer sp. PDNC004 TaxID=2811423 RepID=UPI001963A1E8|nr:hypothetical protein [Ensifer sp. PDNC004]QRY67964.1 hypothetical protein JVX98_27075 [Ensifer sp. PDNC004]